MKKKILFEGCATALITPFCDGGIDFRALGLLIDSQINAGIGALVVAGTTGEASVLTERERAELYSFARERTFGRCALILGTGSNDTARAEKYTRLAAELGADGALVVTPYYNRGTRTGIVSHYLHIADSADIPILLYNVPARTGVNLSLEAIAKLADCERIVGIKEASDSSDRLTSLSLFGDALHLYAGNDSQIYSTLALGGRGVISVASNALPSLLVRMTRDFAEGKHTSALDIQRAILPFVNALFADTNPAPIKYLMHKLGYCREDIRLPLSLPTSEVADKLWREYSAIADY